MKLADLRSGIIVHGPMLPEPVEVPQFWRLAQSLSALYPIGTDEKRRLDGALARKKGLGFR